MPYTFESHLSENPIIYAGAEPGTSVCVCRSETFALQLIAHQAVQGYQSSRGVYIERYGRHEHWVITNCGLGDMDDHVGWVQVQVKALAAVDTLTYYRVLREFAPWRCRRKLEYPGGMPWAAHRIASKQLRDYRSRLN